MGCGPQPQGTPHYSSWSIPDTRPTLGLPHVLVPRLRPLLPQRAARLLPFSHALPFFTRRLLGEDLPATLPKTPSPPPSHPHQHSPAPFFSSAPIRAQRTTDFTFHYVIFSLLRRHGFSTRAAVSSVCSFAVSPVPLEQCLAQNVFANAWKGGGEGGKE